jgi:hypothetical protein
MLSKANVRGLLAGLGLAGALALLGSSCNQAIVTAPAGSTMSVLANPSFIPANGGVSVITAILFDPTGQPVADGTVVQFFTTLGRIDEQGRTNDGVARVNLVSDGRSGQAKVTAYSGGAAAAAPTPTPTGSSSSTSSNASRAAVSGETTVDIGTALPKFVQVSAEPRNISASAPRYTTLTATVFDERGNPISNIPVVFRISDDPDFTESLESGGRPVFSDNNGQARDRLWTSLPREGLSDTVKVKAVVFNGTAEIFAEVEIGINF